MKKNSSSKLCFKKIYSVILLVIVSVYSNTAFSRTLIFQSDTEKNSSKPSNQNPVVTNADTDIHSQVNPSLPSSANSELFFMIEQLQQEVNTLRGLFEEQSYELRMLKQSGKDRYLDLDTRILDLTKRLSASSSVTLNESPSSSSQAVTVPIQQAVDKSQIEVKPKVVAAFEKVKQREPTQVETEDYQRAYALIKDKRFDESIIALFAYTENYPDSPLLPNVYYWLGEVYLASSKLDQAKTSFSLVISAYPDSQKVADSLYKLAVTLDLMGEKDLAKHYINDVQIKFPESTSAKLAASYKIGE